MFKLPPPPHNRKKTKKKSVLDTDIVSKTDRGGTLKRLLLRTTPARLKEPRKARQKPPSAISVPKAFPVPFCTRACAPKASPTPPTPPSARLEFILLSYISSEAFLCRNSRFKWHHRSQCLACCSFADGVLNNFLMIWRWQWRFEHLPKYWNPSTMTHYKMSVYIISYKITLSVILEFSMVSLALSIKSSEILHTCLELLKESFMVFWAESKLENLDP